METMGTMEHSSYTTVKRIVAEDRGHQEPAPTGRQWQPMGFGVDRWLVVRSEGGRQRAKAKAEVQDEKGNLRPTRVKASTDDD
ncbi:uncharacterized protein SPSK_02074 [Sporothrix schenckii 1099-18]|uniref:Uncharacterized protein n=1 Tax=Sporothrix schenckii 1099-18 TaxID=1397361 RepID=A0A0F2MCX0_SPOSC|nr:uncharacterized protein SPSK_02074 [Sporothrix schenckii 1099-18]KJR87482.1 hypothetical protein SPSK_02074 [Sporothrix schenckii 1099-18]